VKVFNKSKREKVFRLRETSLIAQNGGKTRGGDKGGGRTRRGGMSIFFFLKKVRYRTIERVGNQKRRNQKIASHRKGKGSLAKKNVPLTTEIVGLKKEGKEKSVLRLATEKVGRHKKGG